jgi:hypothetical protein
MNAVSSPRRYYFTMKEVKYIVEIINNKNRNIILGVYNPIFEYILYGTQKKNPKCADCAISIELDKIEFLEIMEDTKHIFFENMQGEKRYFIFRAHYFFKNFSDLRSIFEELTCEKRIFAKADPTKYQKFRVFLFCAVLGHLCDEEWQKFIDLAGKSPISDFNTWVTEVKNRLINYLPELQ